MLKKTFFLLMLSNVSFNIFAQQRNFIQFHSGWRAFNTDLATFNNTLPPNSKPIKSTNNAFDMGMDVILKNVLISSDISIGTRQRSYPSAYEQIIFTQSRWSMAAGPVASLGKKKQLQFATTAGIAYGSLDVSYRNDTLNKESSMPWIINQQPSLIDQDPRHYTNPAFLFIAEQRITYTIRNLFFVTGLVGYQHDIGRGLWHYEYGFVRRNSPETWSTGLTYGLKLGIKIPVDDL